MFRSILVFTPFLLLVGFAVFAQRPDSPMQPNQTIRPIAIPTESRTHRTQRIREGTAFKDMFVTILHQADGRTVAYTIENNQRRFECLKNLTLERVLTTMQEKPERQHWKIAGEFTEFHGENFILIRRAVVAYPPATNGADVP